MTISAVSTSREAAGRPHRESGESQHAGLPYVAALDGVRAFAVAGVLAYHGGISWLPGGYFGVDTFFVLSGFLITALLLSEHQRTGRIRLGDFWARRARRLLPALFLMLITVVLVARLFLPTGTYPSLRGDMFSSAFYFANWHFIAQGANYFAATGPPSPLTHTWSLAVEEQFYLVWPLLVVGVLALFKRIGAVFWLALLGALASATAMAVLFSHGANVNRLYYGTDTRAQSILLGAALAAALAWCRQRGMLKNLDVRQRLVFLLIGVAGFTLEAVLWTNLRGTQNFLYQGGFLIAALGTAAVLLSVVVVPRTILGRYLAWWPLVWLGRISYGVYLWHFPIFLWVDTARTGLGGAELFVLRVVITLIVAAASYYLVELPIRRGSLTRGRIARLVTPAAVGTVALVAVVGTSAVSSSSSLAIAPPAGHGAVAPPAGHTTGAPAAPLSRVLLVGDSMAQTLGNGIEGATAQHYGLTVDNMGTPDCSLAVGEFQIQGNPPQEPSTPCQQSLLNPGWLTDWSHEVRQFQPQVSVFLARLDIMNRDFGGQLVHIGDPTYDAYLEAQMTTAVQVLSAGGGKVVFLTTPYYDTGEQPNGQPWPEDDPTRVDEYNAMLRHVAAQHPGVVYVLDLNKIADPDGHFQAVIDGVPVRYTDGIHWTFAGDAWLAPRILPQIALAAQGAAGQQLDITNLRTASLVSSDTPQP
jgi:peptidoglycan/LPS O-acetylase OafA/YrhL